MKEATIITIYCAVFILIHLGMALPPALRDRSWKRLGIALVLSFFGIVLPIFVFSVSAFLVPNWKGGCHHGWLDCFHVGKLALLPLVLWASAAFYMVEIFRTSNRTRAWITLGFFIGAIVSSVCFGFGIILLFGSRWHDIVNGWSFWLLVPLYVSVWYLMRTWQLLEAPGTTPKTLVTTILGTTPFWIAAVIWSRKYYASLPDAPPSCFIATAAMRGHPVVVGSRFHVNHYGEGRYATRQLLTLWLFEELWMNLAPWSHAKFRRFYNIIGPAIASRITTPFLADVAFLAIKPAEIMARGILKTARSRAGVHVRWCSTRG